MNTVRMINSVGDRAAGEEYALPDDVADSFIIKGYAAGDLSRDYTEHEIADLLDGHQSVSV